MQISRQWKQYLLICSLIIVLVSIDCRTRLEQNTQVLFYFHEMKNTETADVDYLKQISGMELGSVFLLTEQLIQQEHFYRLIRNYCRNEVSAKCSLLAGAFIIAALAAISQQKCRQIHIHDIWYIRHRYDHIIYIQNTDGPKRIAMQK